jgi:hypothetical protein
MNSSTIFYEGALGMVPNRKAFADKLNIRIRTSGRYPTLDDATSVCKSNGNCIGLVKTSWRDSRMHYRAVTVDRATDAKRVRSLLDGAETFPSLMVMTPRKKDGSIDTFVFAKTIETFDDGVEHFAAAGIEEVGPCDASKKMLEEHKAELNAKEENYAKFKDIVQKIKEALRGSPLALGGPFMTVWAVPWKGSTQKEHNDHNKAQLGNTIQYGEFKKWGHLDYEILVSERRDRGQLRCSDTRTADDLNEQNKTAMCAKLNEVLDAAWPQLDTASLTTQDKEDISTGKLKFKPEHLTLYHAKVATTCMKDNLRSSYNYAIIAKKTAARIELEKLYFEKLDAKKLITLELPAIVCQNCSQHIENLQSGGTNAGAIDQVLKCLVDIKNTSVTAPPPPPPGPSPSPGPSPGPPPGPSTFLDDDLWMYISIASCSVIVIGIIILVVVFKGSE